LRPRLLVLSGPLKDSTIPLAEGEVTIGREASNGVAVIDPSVSRKHCAVLGREGKFQVRDLESRNGTLVNGAVVEEHWLQHGDEIGAAILLSCSCWKTTNVAAPGRVEFEMGRGRRRRRLSIRGTWFICSRNGCSASCLRRRK